MVRAPYTDAVGALIALNYLQLPQRSACRQFEADKATHIAGQFSLGLRGLPVVHLEHVVCHSEPRIRNPEGPSQGIDGKLLHLGMRMQPLLKVQLQLPHIQRALEEKNDNSRWRLGVIR